MTLGGLPATGKVFEGGEYLIFNRFDPVITRVITDDTRIELWQTEPVYNVSTWTPTTWGLINSVRAPDGLRQQLVVIPAQYRALGGQVGLERLFTTITYTVYYSTTEDTIPPSIWEVRTHLTSSQANLTVDVTDFSGVVRTVAAYTAGDGIWRTADLAQTQGNSNMWTGSLPLAPRLEALSVTRTRYEGPTGIVGTLHDACRRAGVPAMSLWVSVPPYLGATENPKAALALLQTCDTLLGLKLNLAGLIERSLSFEKQVDAAIAGNDEVKTYVEELEKLIDAGGGPAAAAEAELPPAGEIIGDLEDFLRRQRGGG